MSSNVRAEAGEYIDDSEFENFDGHLLRRPVPKEEHADLQLLITNLLSPLAKKMGGKARQEWSISDDKGRWLTPDVTVAHPNYQSAKHGHLLIPAYLVVEIRSDDQHIKDLFDKRLKYRAWGTTHYWMIDPSEKACYECLPEIVPVDDRLRTRDFELSVAEIFP